MKHPSSVLIIGLLTGAIVLTTVMIVIPQPSPKVELAGALLGANPQKIVVQGDYAYVAAGGFFLILNIADPAHPQLISRVDTPGEAMDVKVAGNYAYVADGLFGLRTIDISDPANPVEKGVFMIMKKPTLIRRVELSGTYAYLADYYNGLRIVDVSNPFSPREIGLWSEEEGRISVTVSGRYAYVAGANFYVVDISNPQRPKTISRSFQMGMFDDVTVRGNYAYTDRFIIDISNPKKPHKLGEFKASGNRFKPISLDEKGDYNYTYAGIRGNSIAAAGNYVYLADVLSGLRIFDISDLLAPAEKGACDTPGQAMGVTVIGNYAYVADGTGIRVIDVSNPATPIAKGNYDTPAGTGHDIAISGTYAYLAEDDGLRVIDISNPSTPKDEGICLGPLQAKRLTIQGKIGYMVSESGLHILDISNPASPKEIKLYEKEQGVRIAESAGVLYIADGTTGKIELYEKEQGVRIATSAGTLYVGDGTTGKIISYEKEQGVGIAASAGVLYIAKGNTGLRIVDISIASSPEEKGFYDIKGKASGVAVNGKYAYVTGGPVLSFSFSIDGGLYIIDVNNVSNPKRIGFCDTPGDSYNVAVNGNYAYVADGVNGGLRIIDISNPARPKEKGHFDTRGEALHVALNGNYAYVADGLLGVSIIDISNPVSPKEIAYLDTPGRAEAVAAVGDYVYVADNGAGFLVFKVQSQGTSD